MPNVLFIVNPIAGNIKTSTKVNAIHRAFKEFPYAYEIIITESEGDATNIARQYNDSFEILVAVGGDGTINEVVNGLNKSNILGIIPCGSGNGLANSLNIPRSERALARFIESNSFTTIDTISVNGKICINMAGVGFDGLVAKLFRESKTRGLISYTGIVMKQFRRYKHQSYKMSINGEKVQDLSPFLISFANSTQFGNNAHIAPYAKMNDGLIEICVLDKFPVIAAPTLVYRLFSGTINTSRYYHQYTGQQIIIECEEKLCTHLDGEYIDFGNKLDISIVPNSLKVLTGVRQ